MLISFHYCVILIFQILRNRKRLKLPQNAPSNTVVDEVDLETNLKFDPPVFRQRYSKVYEILLDEKWRNNIEKLADFGCGEFGLFVFIKSLNIKQIFFIDIDETLLQEKIGRIEPLLVDQLRRRNCPLEVSVFVGSVMDPDYRLKKTDVITALELIEHLYPDTLDAFPYNVFSFVEPKIVIVTTPNADFNILFKRNGFRHLDHKFEWTRNQFVDWGTNIVERFPNYTVEFSGVGKGPEDTEELGCCSQLAVFIRKDLLYDKYISPLYAKTCLCTRDSLCKGQTTESKLLCSCLCPLCLPDFSLGICTYFSRSKKNIKTEDNSIKSYSDTNLEYRFQPTYNTFSKDRFNQLSNYINPSHNIYYQLIQKIDYPYEVDTRSEKDRLLQTFHYRIQIFSNVNSRFYVSTRERCEIPVKDIMYGDISVSEEEVRHLLVDADYQIEKCIIQETGSCEDCIISLPQEMEDITSSSEVTDEYNSKSSEPNESTKFEANVDTLSDWDEVIFSPMIMQQGATSSGSEPKKPNPDPLFDSGYLKSPSPLETNPKLPQENPELSETDRFEDVVNTPNLSSDDNKLHLKKTAAKEKFTPPSILDSQKPKYDPNRVNELDRFHNMTTTKTFMSSFLKPQNEFKKGPFKDIQVAGPSSSWKKIRKSKEKRGTEKEKKENVEPSPLDDAKSITNCIILNSLNKIAVDDEVIGRQAELIRDLSPQQEIIPDVGIVQEQEAARLAALEVIHDALVAPQVVENGDLANNNRDNEGNNLVANIVQEQDIDEGIDLLNDNLEELMPLLEDNVNAFDNNNDLAAQGNNLEMMELPIDHNVDEVEDNVDRNEVESEGGLEIDDSVERASREALFDANSEQDLLEDFDIPPQANQDNVLEMISLDSSLVLVGLRSVNSNGTRQDQQPAAASIQTNTSSFPNWLLQILGNHVVPEEPPPAPLGSHDEPHFYCQGDGLGVHPSVIAVEVDEAEDADNDTSTEESSSNNTADFAEVEPGPSDMFDMSSLPEESSLATSIIEDSTPQSFRAVGSVEWTERGPTENFTAVPSPNISVTSDHILLATALVDEIIRTAVREVVLRSQDTSIYSQGGPENLRDDVSTSQNSYKVYTTDSYAVIDSHTIYRPRAQRAELVIAEQPSAHGNGSNEQSESTVSQNEGSLLSSNGSEESEYFDVKNDDT